MEDSDGMKADNGNDSMFMAYVLSPADPENMRIAFGMLIDKVVDTASDAIIDWGTAQFATQRAISDATGQELLYFMMGVRAIDVTA